MFRYSLVVPLLFVTLFFSTIAQAQKKTEQSSQTNWEEKFTPAIEYLKSKNGHALLVYHQDELLYEGYFNGWTKEKPHRLASGTKSFNAAMAIIATQQNLLTFDEKVSETITEWKDDPQKSQITIRELLSLRSGLDPGKIGQVPSYKNVPDLKLINPVGEKFRYGPAPFQVFGELMRRKIEKEYHTPLEYLEQHLFKPIGLEYGYWRKDAQKQPYLPSGAFLTAREWAKFGLLIRDQGKFEGKQILDPKLLQECFRGSKANSQYGICFWKPGRGKLPKDLVMAAGAGKQRLYIIPSRDILVVQFAEAAGKRYSTEHFLNLVLSEIPQ